MKILVTGAKGFVGKNLCAQLKNIRDGKAKNYGLQPALRQAQGPVAELVEAPVQWPPLSTAGGTKMPQNVPRGVLEHG